ncbi:MAG: GntR family transcriptional regulator [Chloroflexi bacterium]|nr:GntR family transcriptional regulator [Chloroflexota bacterium]
MSIRLDPDNPSPIFEQIVDVVRARIVRGEWPAGHVLPTVRDLAHELGVNPNTVGRAYRILHQEGLVDGRSRLGTRVVTHPQTAQWREKRDSQLRLLVAGLISDSVARGFSLSELEAAFTVQRLRWQSGSSASIVYTGPGTDSFIGLGSHDVCLDVLLAQTRRASPAMSLSFGAVGSLAGLLALGRGEVHFASAHLHDSASDDYNLPQVRGLLPDAPCALITLAHRTQGLIVARGNPKRIFKLSDLARRDVCIVNRQRGSGTRGHLDEMLRRDRIPSKRIRGYAHEEATHTAVAAAVANGHADAGLGIEAAARAFGLDFVPVLSERFEIVLPRQHPLVECFRRQIAQESFQQTVSALGGYDLSEAGCVRYS